MQIWNSEELLLVLDIIVLSLENNFKRLQTVIVLMKQMWKTVKQPHMVKKQQQRLTEVEVFVFSVQLVFVSRGTNSCWLS